MSLRKLRWLPKIKQDASGWWDRPANSPGMVRGQLLLAMSALVEREVGASIKALWPQEWFVACVDT